MSGRLSEELISQSRADFVRLLPPKSRIRVKFSREAGGLVLQTSILRHGDSNFWVASPEEISIEDGSPAQVVFYSDKALFIFATKLAWREKEGRLGIGSILALERPASVKRIQRRSEFRLAIRLPVEVNPADDESHVCEGVSLDLSASGMRAALEEEFKAGDRIDISFALPGKPGDRKPFLIRGGVIREITGEELAEEKKIGSRFKYKYGLGFDEIGAKDISRLSKYLWDRQKGKAVR